jgi:assimilatory nitrate reductase catalytic subunit
MSGLSHFTRTTCAYCGVGCGVLAGAIRTAHDGQHPDASTSFAVAGDPAHPSGHGRLCSKGLSLADTLGSSGRLLGPRIDGRDVGWDEALDTVASRFAATIAEHGPESVAFYVSGQLLTEDYYVANKLMKGFIGSANIDTNSRLCMSSAVVAHQRAFGEDVVPGCYEDLELADLLVLVGSNTAWCHPVLWRRVEDARRRRPSMRVVVIDPRKTATCAEADLHLALKPGSDVVLFDGLLAWLDREGCTDEDFVSDHTDGAEEALAVAHAEADDVAEVAARCGLDAADVEEFYRLFAKTERVVTAFSQGVNQSSSGSDKATSILNCHLLTGRIGKPGCGPFSLTGQPNAMGGREVGGMASMLAAHLHLEDEDHRALVRSFWKSPRIAARPGLKAVDLFEAVGEGRVKAIWIMATNPVVSLPDADRVRDALASCDFVVVSDCVAATDTTKLAHVLLPAQGWGERDGTTTNSERCIARQRAFVRPTGLARPDWWIISQVATRMGFAEAFPYSAPYEIFDEHARLSAEGNDGTRAFHIGGLAGLSAAEYDALEPICWPVPERGAQGTARLFGDGRFFHAGGRARFLATTPRSPRFATTPEYPFVLNSGRIRDQWHTMTRTGRSPLLAEHLPEPFVDLHEDDAAASGITGGDLVRVRTRWGSAILKARLSGESARGALFVPMHWSAATSSSGRIGALVNPAVDPASGEPEFKHTPAAIERVDSAWHAVLCSRDGAAPPAGAWWVRIQCDGFVRFEMSGLGEEPDWSADGHALIGAAAGEHDVVEYADRGSGSFRLARLVDARLEACLYVSRAPEKLPVRGWLAGMFARTGLHDADRLALIAARPLDGLADDSALVCSCFGVRRRTIETAIEREGLETPAQIGACLKAGTNCGSCLPELCGLLAAAAPNRSAAA